MKLNYSCHAIVSFKLGYRSSGLPRRIAIMLDGAPLRDSHVPAALEIAFRAPFVHYWRAMVELSTAGLVFSKNAEHSTERHGGTSVIQQAKHLVFDPFGSGHLRVFFLTAPGLPAPMSRRRKGKLSPSLKALLC